MLWASWEGGDRRRLSMKRSPRSIKLSPLLKPLPFLLGVVLGAAWVFRLNEEQQRRIKKNLFELREMPFRIFI